VRAESGTLYYADVYEVYRTYSVLKTATRAYTEYCYGLTAGSLPSLQIVPGIHVLWRRYVEEEEGGSCMAGRFYGRRFYGSTVLGRCPLVHPQICMRWRGQRVRPDLRIHCMLGGAPVSTLPYRIFLGPHSPPRATPPHRAGDQEKTGSGERGTCFPSGHSQKNEGGEDCVANPDVDALKARHADGPNRYEG